MTGPGQVMGSARFGLSDMVNLNYHYVCNRTAWFDVRILAQTVVLSSSSRCSPFYSAKARLDICQTSDEG